MVLIDHDDTGWTAWTEGPPRANALLTQETWDAVRTEWPRDLPAGVTVSNGFDVEGLARDLPRWSMVVLQFPTWTDGRAYSQARLLRTRLRYTGDLRAEG